MRGFNGLPLDDDIIDRIIQFSPSFETLQSVILTSKSFHQVYKAHPRSLIRAVAYNIVGPALPQALRAIRYCESDEEHTTSRKAGEDSDTDSGSETEPDSDDDNNEKKVSNAFEEDGETDEKEPITREEARKLDESTKMVSQLEDLFSLRHKNRRFKTSQLTPTESYRFRRALYRIMLYCRIFKSEKYDDWRDYDDDDDNNIDEVRNVRRARKEFLRKFYSDELLQIYAVSLFFLELVEWVKHISGESMDMSEYVLAMGPEAVSQSVNEEDLDCVDEYLYVSSNPMIDGYLSWPISKILEERQTKIPEPDDPSVWRSILDVIDGEKDPCGQCKTPTGLNLLGPSTYDFICRGFSICFTPSNLTTLLKGNLSRSSIDRTFFLNQVMSTDDSGKQIFLYHKLFEGVFEDDIRQPGFEDWKKDDWLCEGCLQQFSTEHLYLWLLDLKKKAGETIPEDCWYGYDCRTITHKVQHAQNRNHLCKPTR